MSLPHGSWGVRVRAIAAIGVKLLGVSFAVSSISGALVSLMTWSSVRRLELAGDPDSPVRIALIGAPLAMAAVGVGLVIWGNALAVILCRGLPDPTSARPSSPQLLHIGLTLLGVYFVGTGLPGVAVYVWQLVETLAAALLWGLFNAGTSASLDSSAAREMFDLRSEQNFAGSIVRVGMGFVLIVLAGPLSRKLLAREGGTA